MSKADTTHEIEKAEIEEGLFAFRVTVEKFAQVGGKLRPEHSGGFITYNHSLEKTIEMQSELLPIVADFLQKDEV